jgi:ABC-type bacteriocin/lantibiotic exporter with double-glycine peptidase domain
MYFSKIIFLLGKSKRKIPFIILLFIFLSLIELLSIGLIAPYISLISEPSLLQSYEVDQYISLPSSHNELILIFSYTLLAVFLFKAAFSLLINYIIINFGYNQQVELSSKLIDSYQHMNYLNYLEKNSSEYVRNISQLVEQYSTVVIIGGLRAISESFVAIFLLVFLAVTDILIFTLLLSLLILVITLYDFVFKNKIKQSSVESNIAHKKMIQNLNETIFSIKESRISAIENFFHKKTVESISKYGRCRIIYKIITSIPKYLIEFSVVAFITSIVILTIEFNGDFTKMITTIIIFGMVSVRMIPISNILASTLMQFRFAKDGILILHKDLMSSEKGDHKFFLDKKVPKFKELIVSNVSFKYANANVNALTNVNLSIKQGELIGIMGESGSGKTTLIDLILGLISQKSGDIEFNAMSIKNNLQEWRSCIAYLPQQPLLIDDSIKNNIALGYEKIDKERLLNAIQKSKLNKLIRTLPNGVESLVGENGAKISGGQRQRIALARAFYNNKQVIILDEPTSALDGKTAGDIFKELNRLKKNVTIIVITHSDISLRYFDRIYQLYNGNLVNK